MRVTRQSSFSGKLYSWDLPITPNQMQEWCSPNRRLIQHIFPNLTAEQREFLQTGVTPDEWAEEFQPRTWIEMAELTEKVKKGVKIVMKVDLDLGRYFKKDEEYTIEENNLNEMEAAVVVLNSKGEMGLIPGPIYSYRDEAPGKWDEEASFRLVLEKRDASLGIVHVVE